MKKSGRRRWPWIVGLIGLVMAGSAMLYMLMVEFGECSKDRLPWKCVSWSEVERYGRQISEDLPRGTSQQAVEDYLRRENVPFSYLPPIYSSSGKSPIRIGRNLPIGSFGGIVISITFDASGNVDEIKAWRTKIRQSD